VNELFTAQTGEDDQALLESELPQDEHLFAELLRLEPEKDYALEFMFDYKNYQGDYKSALMVLEDAKDLEAGWADDTVFSVIYAKLGRFGDALKVIENQAATMVEEGHLAEDEQADYVQYFYERSLRKAEAFGEIINYYKRQSDFAENPQALYQVGCLYCLLTDLDQAFVYLDRAVVNGFDSAATAKDDDDLAALRSDPRWEKIIARIEANWEAGREKRREKALAGKFSKPAPTWILKNEHGNEVDLADLRGNVLIFDFWATWCSPCRMAMPVLDSWLREDAPAGVQVYSINVWESFPLRAKKFMADNGYAMTLLFGNNEIAQAYGIAGIPYICVVDSEGNIRYEEKGYEEGLGEKLNWWVEDLLAEVDSGS
jgi:thiol-disulfide isomerase/thioredoxin